ncbi:MAG: amino acid ABC transporter permease, partial [Clostridia bacterium]
TNEVITLIKDTALASTVAVVELMTIAKKQVSSSSSIEPYIVAILLYLLLNGLAEQLCKLAERKLDYYR